MTEFCNALFPSSSLVEVFEHCTRQPNHEGVHSNSLMIEMDKRAWDLAQAELHDLRAFMGHATTECLLAGTREGRSAEASLDRIYAYAAKVVRQRDERFARTMAETRGD